MSLLAGCGRLPSQAAPGPRIPRVGYLAGESDVGEELFGRALREQGYVEGQNILVEWRAPAGPAEYPALAGALVRLPVDVIVAPTTTATLAAKQATSTIPIVFITAGNPVGDGLVDSLARPGGNVTGVTSIFTPLGQKRLELLKEAAPRLSRVACLYGSSNPASTTEMQLVVAAAGAQGVTVEAFGVQTAEDLDRAFEAAGRWSADALLVTSGSFLLRQRQRIVEFAASSRLPAIYAWREAVESGGLMSYGPSLAGQFKRAAYYVDRLLNGTRPADLPVEQPMIFDFVVNMRMARELGIAFPAEILLQVTETIQ
jgi:putative tryptophan/tyrosine transport system substrate-binding protein